jgi:hypothetical protein
MPSFWASQTLFSGSGRAAPVMVTQAFGSSVPASSSTRISSRPGAGCSVRSSVVVSPAAIVTGCGAGGLTAAGTSLMVRV